MSSAADAPGSVLPDPEGGQEGGQAARPGGSGDDAVGSPTRRRLVRTVTALAVAAAVAAGVLVAVTGNPAPGAAGAADGAGVTNGAAARPAVLANEAAATVAVVKTGGSITGGPVLGRDGRLWLVEASSAGQPILTAVNPATYAVSRYPLPASLGALSLRYTGAEAFDNVGQLWLGATAAAAGQPPTGMLVRYLLAAGAITSFSLAGTCSGDPAKPPAQLSAASDGGVWVECPSPDSAATSIVRLQRNGAFMQPYVANYLNRGLLDTSRWNGIANLPQAEIGPLAAVVGGVMWGMTAGGFVQLTATGAETFIPASLGATELTTQAVLRAQLFQLAGNSQSLTAGGVGECRAVDAPASQARECAISAGPGGEIVLAAAPDYDGHVGNQNVHPAGLDASGDLWFIVDGTAGGQAPGGQYFFEATSGGGTRIVPFSVPGDTLPIPVVQAPVITVNGAVWTVDPEPGPGTLVGVMPKN